MTTLAQILFLVLLAPAVAAAQATDPCAAPGGVKFVQVPKGTPITVCFDYPDEQRPQVKLFRVRASQTPAGAYNAVASLPPDAHYYQFIAQSNRHIFISTVWDETGTDGKVTSRESPGSEHVEVEILTSAAGPTLWLRIAGVFKQAAK